MYEIFRFSLTRGLRFFPLLCGFFLIVMWHLILCSLASVRFSFAGMPACLAASARAGAGDPFFI